MERRQLTRRRILAGSVTGGFAFFAGCLSNDDNDDSDQGTDDDAAHDGHTADGVDTSDDDPVESPTDPDEDDYADRSGMDEVEIITREGEDGEPEFVFEPAFVAVDPGTTIRWLNEDGVFHTVTSIPDLDDRQGGGEVFDAEIADEGDTFEWVPENAGMYHYYCRPHVGFMWGSVAVLDDGAFPDEAPVDDQPDDDDDDPDDDLDKDDEYTDVPEELPTDPDDDDFVDATGQTEVEVITRQGREDEPNFVFDPPFVRVDQGTTIRWVNRDGVFHTVTSTDALTSRSGGGSEFDATITAEGDTFEWIAEEPGRQDYYCSPHAGFMFGSIAIED